MQRLIVVYNPRSSKYKRVAKEVLAPTTGLKGFLIGKFEVKPTDVIDNAKHLAGILQDDDLVIAAGGDGTATIGLNGIMLSQAKNVRFGVLGYGNFNDFSRMLGEKNINEIIKDFQAGKEKDLYPLEMFVDRKFFRFAACYFSIGMFAMSTEIFDHPNLRTELQTGKKGIVFSLLNLAHWYFKNWRAKFLPEDIQINDKPLNKMVLDKDGKGNHVEGAKVSDVMFVNGKTVAKMMKGKKTAYQTNEFFVSTGKLSNFFRLCWFMFKSIFGFMPGKMCTRPVKIDFCGPQKIEIQGEGEYENILASEIIVAKASKSVKVICKK